MNIRAIVPCVDYSDLLSQSIKIWQETVDELLIVSSPHDQQTIQLYESVRNDHTNLYLTSIWYENGAAWNKGAGLSEAVLKTGFRNGAEWIVSFDADIIPPSRWRWLVETTELDEQAIYGATRHYHPAPEDVSPKLVPGEKMPQSFVIGFFNLFHNHSPYIPLPSAPLWDLCWPHAGNVDTLFMRRFPTDKRHILPIEMTHIGEERKNWCGRFNRQGLKEVLDQRSGWEDWERERMPNPPKITL